MPLSTGSGELQIVGRQDVGGLGPSEGPPAVFQWKWHYSVPSLAFLALAILPLVLVRHNRQPRAWAILIPLLAVLVLWNWIAVLFGFSPSTIEYGGTFVAALATAWAVLWALAHWFQGRLPFLAFIAALLLMSVVIIATSVANGMTQSDSLLPLLIYQLIFSVALLLPMVLSGLCCRKTYSPKRFMGWLLLWTILTQTAEMLVLALPTAFIMGAGPGSLLFVLPMIVLFAGLFGIGLYLLNLPFMLLVFNNSLYRDRFRKIFGLRES